jgi:dehydrogenase/reductase SDR family protein 7
MICPGPVVSEFGANKILNPTVDDGTSSTTAALGGGMMTAQRCADLMATAIARYLPEVWLSPNPFLLFTYLYEYLPLFSKRILVPAVSKSLVESAPRSLGKSRL